MELMLASLATCSAATIAAIVDKMRLDLDDIEVAVDADRAEDSPRVWTDIEVRFHIRSEGPLDRLERAVALSGRTCSAAVMMARAAHSTESLYVVREIAEPETVALRHRLLRAGQPLSAVKMHGDDAAVWFGVVHNRKVEGTAGLFRETSPDGDSGYRLRGMTTSVAIRGSGLGRMLVDALVDRVRTDGGDSIWCAARVEAAGFYEQVGFERTSEEYDVEDLGPHVRMKRVL